MISNDLCRNDAVKTSITVLQAMKKDLIKKIRSNTLFEDAFPNDL